MPDKNITNDITYNFLNLPEQIIQNTNPVTYTYRADGVKIHKQFVTNGQTLETDYLDGFVYTTPYTEGIEMALQANPDAALAGQAESLQLSDKAIIKDPGGPIKQPETTPNFFPTAEGFYDYDNFMYIYQYKDHLGNVRLSYVKDPDTGEAVGESSNDYYPFGLNFINIPGRHAISFYNPSLTFENYKYNGKELQETGFYDYGSRQYMPDIVRWGTVDKLSEKYPFASNYAYVLNRPTVAVDPDGKRVYFIGGAGNDQDGWDYVNRWARAFASNGINDFYRVNATRGSSADIEFTAMYRNTGYDKMNSSMYPSGMGGFGTSLSNSYNTETKPVQDDMIDATVSMYQQQLKDNPLQEGEQFNMVGYSYGSVLQAQSALRLADSGQVIDNLVLIGSPISDKSDLMKQLQGNKNIKNVTRYDLKGDLISNPKDILQFLQGGIETKAQGDDAHHFDAARPGNQADQLMNTIVQWLQQQGVNN